MSGAAFPSPAAEMAEINRLQYEMEYTEGISQRMRVPEKLKVAPPNADLEKDVPEGFPNASVTMQVPERIVVAGMAAPQYKKNKQTFKLIAQISYRSCISIHFYKEKDVWCFSSFQTVVTS